MRWREGFRRLVVEGFAAGDAVMVLETRGTTAAVGKGGRCSFGWREAEAGATLGTVLGRIIGTVLGPVLGTIIETGPAGEMFMFRLPGSAGRDRKTRGTEAQGGRTGSRKTTPLGR